MNAREIILAAVKANKPAAIELPVINVNVDPEIILEEEFKKVLAGIGGQVVEVDGLSAVRIDLEQAKSAGGFIVNALPELGETATAVDAQSTAVYLESVQKVYLRGSVGVAENGAIWLDQTNMINRLLPFICQHLVLILDKENLVPNMHEAYKRIQTDKEGFGVFIAGPSKTADIEQSLVIGAHGARSLVVYLVKS